VAIVTLRENAWADFVPFRGFDPESRTVIYVHQRHRGRERADP